MKNRTLYTYGCAANQERFILASLSSSANYHLPVSFRVRGAVDTDRLKRCVHRIVKADDALNVSIARDQDGRFCCERKEDSVAEIRHERATGKGLDEHVEELKRFVFDDRPIFEQALCKCFIFELAPEDAIITLSLHHVVADGVSLGLFIAKLSAAYSAGSMPRDMAETDTSFPHLLKKYQLRPGEWSAEEQAFWIASLAGRTESGALVPDDTEDGGPERRCVHRVVRKEDYERVRSAATTLGVTSFHFVYAAYLIALSRHTGSKQVLTTFQSSGRYDKPDTEGVIGQFSNALAYVTDLPDGRSFADLAHDVKQAVRLRVSNERFPYHEVIKATGQHAALGINWYPQYAGLDLGSAHCEQLHLVEWQSDYDLNLHCLTRGGELELRLSYPAHKFDSSRVSLFLEQVENLLLEFSADTERPIGQVGLRTSRDDALPSIHATWPRKEYEEGIYERFLSSAARYPTLPALHYRGEFIMYSELLGKVDSLSQVLRDRGCRRGARIAILANRCPALVVSMLAVLRAEGSFAVFDGDYPAARLSQFSHVLRPHAAIVVGEAGRDIDGIDDAIPAERIFVGERGDFAEQQQSSTFAVTAAEVAEAVAYFLFTSGTTGLPKCVKHPREPLLNFIEWHSAEHRFGTSTRFALTSGLGHDPVMRDIFSALFNGACCYVPPNDFTANPRKFWQWLRDHEISVLHATPQVTKLIVLGQPIGETLESLEQVFWGGDVLTKSIAVDLLGVAPRAKGVNFYGATETPQAVAAYDIDTSTPYSYIPIGNGVAGAQVLVLGDANLQSAGFGEMGQIAVRSHFLAEGYLGAADEGHRFQELGAVPEPGPRHVYLTGDFGYYLPDGSIRLVGRRDKQVKIRGYRVETKEIEAFLENQNSIRQAVVVPIGRGDGEQVLAAYFVRAQGSAVTLEDLRSSVAARFPSYMLPAFFVEIAELPLSRNGKVDYALLPRPSFDDSASVAEYAPPRNRVEREVVALVERVLGAQRISVHSTFASLGADSLSFVMASMELERIIGTLPAKWEDLTLRELAGTRRKESLFTTVESSVFIRAMAICAVVAGHFNLIHFAGAAEALFLVAGFSFGRFQIGALEATGNVGSSYRLIARIAVPTVLYTMLVESVFHNFNMLAVLLLSNFADPNAAGGFNYWFVMVLIQNLIILTAAVSIKPVREFTRRAPLFAGLIALGITYLLRVLVPFVWDTDYLYDRVPHMTLWIMALGWCVAKSVTLRDRLVVAALTAGIVFAEFVWFRGVGLTMLAALMLIVAVDRVVVPRPSNKLLNLVAASSLFIYLTHFQFASLMNKLSPHGEPVLHFAGAVAGGVVCYLAWEWLQSSDMARRVWRSAARRLRAPVGQTG